MAGALIGCGGEGFSAAAAGSLGVQCRSRSSPSFSGLCSIGRTSCRFPLGQPLDHCLINRRNVEVRVAADYSDSKPESFKRRGKWGYHPLEDLSKVEKEEMEHAGDGKLTNAEVARTISEVNWNAIIFSSIVSDKDAVYGTEVQYLVDDHGDLYFEVENDNDFLRNLSSTQIYTVLVGYGNVDVLQFSEIIEQDEDGEILAESDSEDDSSDEDNNSDIEIYWDGMEDMEDTEDDTPEESFGSLGGWGGFESLDNVHPMDFASKVSEAVLTDHMTELDKPVRRLSISGVVRPVTEEEEPYVQGIWYDRFLLASDGDEHKGDEEGGQVQDARSGSLSESKNVGSDVGRSVKDEHVEGVITGVRKSDVLGGSNNGIVLDSSLIGSTRLSKGEDLELRSQLFSATELSSSDDSVTELPSSSAHTAEELDAGMNVQRELGTRKNRNIRRGSCGDSSEVKDELVEVESSDIISPPGTTLEGDAMVGEWTDNVSEWTEPTKVSSGGASFYKLEIVSIILDSAPGVQSSIDVRDFAYAEPDILAHFSSAIMERVNSGGKKIENALKTLCQRAKGIDVEEVSVVGIDCLGMDLRVGYGIEVQTIRIPFSRRATCEESADKLLDQLLFPRIGQRRPKKRGQEWNSH